MYILIYIETHWCIYVCVLWACAYVCECAMSITMVLALFRRVRCHIIVGCEKWWWSLWYLYLAYRGHWVLHESRGETWASLLGPAELHGSVCCFSTSNFRMNLTCNFYHANILQRPYLLHAFIDWFSLHISKRDVSTEVKEQIRCFELFWSWIQIVQK